MELPHPTLRTIFLSTPSARRATLRQSISSSFPPISIHALRKEGDLHLILSVDLERNFYPRPPQGGRPFVILLREHCKGFLSTPSARRATISNNSRAQTAEISIHALRKEGDFRPGGLAVTGCISIHALRKEGDHVLCA